MMPVSRTFVAEIQLPRPLDAAAIAKALAHVGDGWLEMLGIESATCLPDGCKVRAVFCESLLVRERDRVCSIEIADELVGAFSPT
jgi:hypothetical protein